MEIGDSFKLNESNNIELNWIKLFEEQENKTNFLYTIFMSER